MLYILLGEDDFSISESLREIKKSIGAEELLDANTSEFQASELTLEQLKAISSTVPFLAEKRLIVVRGLFERFQPKGRAVPKEPSAGKGHEDGHKQFAECIGSLPQSTVLVLIDGNAKRDNPLLLAIQPHAEVKPFPLRKGAGLEKWIEVRVKAAGGSISPKAANLLSRLVGSNLWIMSNEVDKLTLFAQGRRIEEEDVTSLVSSAREVSVFNLVDAILEGRGRAAEEILQRLLVSGEAPPPLLLFMLARQLQMIVRLKDMREHGRPRGEIQSRLGITAEFVWLKTLQQSERYDMPRLKEIYQKLLETDHAVKTGKYDDEIAMSILVAELCPKT